jgi:hypothetical protein
MFGPTGNPQARNLFTVLDHLQREANLRLRVEAVRRKRGRAAAVE